MRWMWIDRIVHHEPSTRLVAVKCVSLAEEHLHDHLPADEPHTDRRDDAPTYVLPASLMIEGMAQTAGILVGSTSGFREKVILAKITRASIDADVGPGEVVRYDATLDRIDASGASTTGVIERRRATEDAWTTIGAVDLVFSHLDRNLAGTAFPEHNFVFSENFRHLLEDSGLASLVVGDAAAG